MQRFFFLWGICGVCVLCGAGGLLPNALWRDAVAAEGPITDAHIDYPGFQKLVGDVEALRDSRRVSERAFIEMSTDPDTVILDARSAAKFAQMHVAGAVNVVFSDLTAASLRAAIPAKSTRILIYCNNNFANATGPFPTKMSVAALNIPTFLTLHAYGYKNVYELGPLVDPATSAIEFAGAAVR